MILGSKSINIGESNHKGLFVYSFSAFSLLLIMF